MIKVYKARNLLSVPVVVGGKIVRRVGFDEAGNTFRTSDGTLQDILEGLPCFGGLFRLSETIVEIPPVGDKPVPAEPIVFPDVTDWQDARDILRRDFGVPVQSLNTPRSILRKADGANVSFPNLRE